MTGNVRPHLSTLRYRIPMPRLHSWLIVAATTLALSRLHAQTDHTSTSTGIDVAGMDRSVKPGDDFFAYANGSWVKETEIPADQTSYGAGAILDELTNQRVSDLIKEMAKSTAAAGSEQQMIGDY